MSDGSISVRRMRHRAVLGWGVDGLGGLPTGGYGTYLLLCTCATAVTSGVIGSAHKLALQLLY